MNERIKSLLIALLVTSMIITAGLALTDSAQWLMAAMPLAAITLVVFRDDWLPHATKLWQEHRTACYTLVAAFFLSAVITGIWGLTVLLVTIGAVIFMMIILWMNFSNHNYKRDQRYGRDAE